jgi:hypothetical protein
MGREPGEEVSHPLHSQRLTAHVIVKAATLVRDVAWAVPLSGIPGTDCQVDLITHPSFEHVRAASAAYIALNLVRCPKDRTATDKSYARGGGGPAYWPGQN